MKRVSFKVFVDGRGKDIIREWRRDVKMPAKCKAKMDRSVRYLEITEPTKWHTDLIKRLRGYLRTV